MKKVLIRQAIFLPFLYFGMLVLAGLFANEYSHWGQHASELGINSSSTAVVLFQTGIIMTSFSLFGLALGLIINFKKQFPLFSLLVFVFGVTFIFGALFPIGSPWHGMYGLGLFVMMVPFVFLYEMKDLFKKKAIRYVSITAAFLMFFYLWSMVARLDPVMYRGLTQRLFGIVVFGWLSYVSYHLYSLVKKA
ncbi:MAG: DUF998 domain-containing protein [Bacteroidales bacterium]|nr:DUF998 domain-containing protein [Bacteroidales bacterium]